MKERPILFSSEMVKAILDGRKTMTRRVMKPQPVKAEGLADDGNDLWIWAERKRYGAVTSWAEPDTMTDEWALGTCLYGKVGDRLWVRETFAEMCHQADPFCWCESEWERAEYHYIEYKADTGCPYPGGWSKDDDDEGRPVWKPSVFMPRAASRILLEVTGVRVERVQDISEGDAKAEGVQKNWIGDDCPPEYDDEYLDYRATSKGDYEGFPCYSARDSFMTLWDTINEARGYGWDTNPFVWVIEFRRIEP